jgi:hypothetical protein
MSYGNFRLSGEDRLVPFAEEEPHRCARLVQALETFLERGQHLGTLVLEKGALAAYLVPPRAVLRGVPDAAALLLIDSDLREIELLEIFPEFGGDDSTSWTELAAQAATHLE